jgi:DNA-binding PadR family transcriptional regulator
MSTTRLLLLGVVRIFQPAYGYQLRRELMTWNVQDWANINPSSIYTGLRTLAKHGYLVELADEGGRRPARTSYKLTSDGETEYFGLLRTALWNVRPFHPDQLQVALNFLPDLKRDEVVAALETRISQPGAVHQAAPVLRAAHPRGPGHTEPRDRDAADHGGQVPRRAGVDPRLPGAGPAGRVLVRRRAAGLDSARGHGHALGQVINFDYSRLIRSDWSP